MLLTRPAQLFCLFVAGTIILFCGCATTKSDWRDARKKDTISWYEQFIKCHPQTREAEIAKRIIESLQAEPDWKAAQSAGTIVAYQGFLSRYPDSKYTSQAKYRLEQLETERDWQSAQAINSITAYKEYLAKHPKSHYESMAKNQMESIETEDDWQKLKRGTGTIEAYRDYYYSHPNSKYAGEVLSTINKLQEENDWKDAVVKNTEDGWLCYIVKYSGNAKADEASRRLRKHTVIRAGGLIPWAALGGKSWSQEDPYRDGFSNLEGAVISNATVIRLPNYFGLECSDKSAFFFRHWVNLNKVKCKGDLRANSKGFAVVSGMALIPKSAK